MMKPLVGRCASGFLYGTGWRMVTDIAPLKCKMAPANFRRGLKRTEGGLRGQAYPPVPVEGAARRVEAMASIPRIGRIALRSDFWLYTLTAPFVRSPSRWKAPKTDDSLPAPLLSTRCSCDVPKAARRADNLRLPSAVCRGGDGQHACYYRRCSTNGTKDGLVARQLLVNCCEGASKPGVFSRSWEQQKRSSPDGHFGTEAAEIARKRRLGDLAGSD
jgi:hypothetical protein